MYTPNFCSECGTKLLRLRWHFWTSRKFCDGCARRLWRVRLFPPFIVMLALVGSGYVTGRVGRPDPPPLIIERRFDSPLIDKEPPVSPGLSSESQAGRTEATGTSPAVEEEIYLCGARTKKGTPCSRRVHGPVRCWQHKGVPAMLAQEKLLVKDNPSEPPP